MWIVLAIAGLAACSGAPKIDADTSLAATTTTSVPTLAVAPAPCGEAVVPGGVDDDPEARRPDAACPARCREAIIPGSVDDDFPEARRLDAACPARCRAAVIPGSVDDDFPEGRRLDITPSSAGGSAC